MHSHVPPNMVGDVSILQCSLCAAVTSWRIAFHWNEMPLRFAISLATTNSHRKTNTISITARHHHHHHHRHRHLNRTISTSTESRTNSKLSVGFICPQRSALLFLNIVSSYRCGCWVFVFRLIGICGAWRENCDTLRVVTTESIFHILALWVLAICSCCTS